jgi:ABC-type transporter Mla subunit MlaD
MKGATAFASALLVALALTGCVAHPVGPARTFSKYEGKAATTANGAASAVETAIVGAKAAAKDKVLNNYLSVLLGDCEDRATKVQGTFDSIQPPNRRADDLRSELDDLLTAAVDDLGEVRIVARRGRPQELANKVDDLADDAKKLEDFDKAHGG